MNNSPNKDGKGRVHRRAIEVAIGRCSKQENASQAVCPEAELVWEKGLRIDRQK
jgi:hypothetical protein